VRAPRNSVMMRGKRASSVNVTYRTRLAGGQRPPLAFERRTASAARPLNVRGGEGRSLHVTGVCVMLLSLSAVAAEPAGPAPGPFAAKPKPLARDTLLPVDAPQYLPPARGTGRRRRGAAVLPPLHVRPVRDLPPLATEPDDLHPRPLFAPSAPRARAPQPDMTGPSALWRKTGPDSGRAVTSTDPTRGHSRLSALAAIPRLRDKAVRFLRLVIPDPFAAVEAVGLRLHPPDDDPPTLPADPPPAPKLPVSPKR